jgi:basic membrane protein A
MTGGQKTEAAGDTADERTVVSPLKRRSLLRTGGAVAGAGLIAGCTGGNGTPTEDSGGGDTTSTPSEDGGDDTTSTPSEGGGGETTNIAIISSPAGFGDRAFNDLALEGLQNGAEEYDIQIQQVEETNQSNYGTVQSRLAESTNPDYDLIVMVGYNHTQALESNASQYSDQYWMLINDYVDQPNVAGYSWANHHMSYLAGVLAGTMTTREFSYEGSSTKPNSSTVGFVGGVDGALINAFERAYRAGVQWVNEDISVSVGYIGNYTDTGTANNIATSQYDSGADIIYHAAAAAGQGVFQAAQESDQFAIGVDADQSVTLPDYQDVIMGSAVKYINRGTFQVAEAVAQDNWSSVQGQNILGLEQEAVDLVLGDAIGSELPDVVNQNVSDAKDAILNGDVTVPCTATGCQN